MKRIRHIRARNDEWVQVHRDPALTPAPPSGDGDWRVRLLLKVGGVLLTVWIIGLILKPLLMFMVLAAIVGAIAKAKA